MKTPIQKAAAALGQKGGKVTSEAKSAAAKANGAKGGRPRKWWLVHHFHRIPGSGPIDQGNAAPWFRGTKAEAWSLARKLSKKNGGEYAPVEE